MIMGCKMSDYGAFVEGAPKHVILCCEGVAGVSSKVMHTNPTCTTK